MTNADLIKRLRDCSDQATKVGHKLENGGDRTGMEILSVSFRDAADALVDLEAKLANAERRAEDAESRNDFLISQLEDLIEKERKDKL